MRLVYLGQPVSYAEGWALQTALHEEVSQGRCDDTLLLLQHPATFTMGRRGGWRNLVTPKEHLLRDGYELWQIDRGGDITYHGPGQLVGYPIINLKRAQIQLGDLLRNMERAHVDWLADFGVEAETAEGFTGVWCGTNKVTAIGVRVSRWTSMHGFAINLTTQLHDFEHIVACGLEGRGVTSLAQEIAPRSVPPIRDCAISLGERFATHFGWESYVDSESKLPQADDEMIRTLRESSQVRE